MAKRVFLGWNRPILPLLAERLLPEQATGPVSFDDTLIIVPTKQAGRRLREHLARDLRKRGGTALLSLQVRTTSSFLASPDLQTADPLDVYLAWQRTLLGTTNADYPHLLPGQNQPMSATGALGLGARLQKLRNDLIDGDLDLRATAQRAGDTPDAERWKDLAKLETAYLAHLEKLDPCESKRTAVQDPRLPPQVNTIILACVPDPAPIVLKALRHLESSLTIESWIHAPEQEADNFDDWGRPKSSWASRELTHWPDDGASIRQTANPKHACQLTADSLASGKGIRPDVALGLLDDSFAPILDRELERVGLAAFHPAPCSLRSHPTVRLIQLLLQLSVDGSTHSLRRLMRFPDLLAVLARAADCKEADLLKKWDRFANESLPGTLSLSLNICKDKNLLPALKSLHKTVTDLRGGTPAASLLLFLQSAYQQQSRSPGAGPDQRHAVNAYRAIADLLQDAARRESSGEKITADILLRVLNELSVDPVRNAESLDAEGWLELPYHPAGSLVLIGLQEGNAPSTVVSDPFLPDGFRKHLQLPCDDDRHPRDAFLLQSMLTCRNPEQIRILCCKTDLSHSPLVPSRLLFQVQIDSLLNRLRELFRHVDAPDNRPPRLTAFPLLWRDNPSLVPAPKSIERISVTAFRDYLSCPGRFYLKHALNMSCDDDSKREPDSRDFGIWVHEALENLLSDATLQNCEDPHVLFDAAAGNLDQRIREQYGETISLAVRVSVRAAKQRLNAACFEQVRLTKAGWITLANELKLEREHKGILVSGKVDRVDFHPDHGLRLIDYKTSDNSRHPAEAHWKSSTEDSPEAICLQPVSKKKEQQWKDLQLPLYRWLFEVSDLAQNHPEVRVGYFNLPKNLQETALTIWDEEAEHSDSAERAMDWVISQLAAGMFEPPAEKVEYDDFEMIAEGLL